MVILFFAHGAKEFLNEVIFAVLSYYQHHRVGEHQVVIYTDNEAYFRQWLPEEVTYVAVDADLMKAWRGRQDYLHRAKIKVIQDAIDRYPKEYIIFIDSDTYFKDNISSLKDKIDEGYAIMHFKEKPFKEAKEHRTIVAYLEAHHHIIETETLKINVDKNQFMGNSGVIGLPPGAGALVENVLSVNDLLYPELKLIFTEQLAFTLVLAAQYPIYEAKPLIWHYFYFKAFRGVIDSFLKENKGKPFKELVRLSSAYNPERMGKEREVYMNLNFWQKLWWKISKGRRWKIIEPSVEDPS